MDIYTIVRELHNDKTSFIRLFGTVVNASFYYVLDNSTIYNNINSMNVYEYYFIICICSIETETVRCRTN
jgi:hypothetical protein